MKIYTTLAFVVFFTLITKILPGYEITLIGGSGMDIPEGWVLNDEKDSSPTWVSADQQAAVKAILWAPGTWDSVKDLIKHIRPSDAVGDVVYISWHEGSAALADWTFSQDGARYRAWFLFVTGTNGPDVRISAYASVPDFNTYQPFFLSVLDSYYSSPEKKLFPGAVARFLEESGKKEPRLIQSSLEGQPLEWTDRPSSNMASQDVIEREALILASYSSNLNLFMEGWHRYYRMVYRDSYRRLDQLAEALMSGPLPLGSRTERETAEALLDWLQMFTYGSTNGFSDLLAPSAAVAEHLGDCDSLALALLILLKRYGVDGQILVSPQKRHALAALIVPGDGLRVTKDGRSYVVAELTTRIPLGTIPARIEGATDWFSVSFQNFQ